MLFKQFNGCGYQKNNYYHTIINRVYSPNELVWGGCYYSCMVEGREVYWDRCEEILNWFSISNNHLFLSLFSSVKPLCGPWQAQGGLLTDCYGYTSVQHWWWRPLGEHAGIVVVCMHENEVAHRGWKLFRIFLLFSLGSRPPPLGTDVSPCSVRSGRRHSSCAAMQSLWLVFVHPPSSATHTGSTRKHARTRETRVHLDCLIYK